MAYASAFAVVAAGAATAQKANGNYPFEHRSAHTTAAQRRSSFPVAVRCAGRARSRCARSSGRSACGVQRLEVRQVCKRQRRTKA